MEILEVILCVGLLIALAASFGISYQVYYNKNKKYEKAFSTWQLPMIFAVLTELLYTFSR